VSKLSPIVGVASSLCRHFGIGVLLIVSAAAILLFSDPRRNRSSAEGAPKKIALINYASVPVLEDGEAGMIAGLKENGFVDGENIVLTRYNAEGDRATAILIAKEAVGGDFDAILTLSTAALQAVANANVDARRTHVFTLTTDPWGAGVGISADDHSKHPPYMTGQGTLQPVAALFRLAREANPKLKRVGVVWNPAESNSESSTLLARDICKKLNIQLVETTVDSSAAVQEAVQALLAQEVEAIWAGGDVTVAAALDTMIGKAHTAGIPVFTNMPGDVKKGAMFCLGADYYTVGKAGGALAARVLKGESPAGIPVDNYVPEILSINMVSWNSFRSNWTPGRDWEKRAKIIVDKAGVHEK
jgi:putative ABC transport system substrate-binding protein